MKLFCPLRSISLFFAWEIKSVNTDRSLLIKMSSPKWNSAPLNCRWRITLYINNWFHSWWIHPVFPQQKTRQMTADRLQKIKRVVLCRYKEILFNIFVYKHRLQMPSKHVCPQDTVFLFFFFLHFFLFFFFFYSSTSRTLNIEQEQESKKLRKVKRESFCGLVGKSHPGVFYVTCRKRIKAGTFQSIFNVSLAP